MLEPILISLFVLWALGVLFFGYFVYFSKIIDGQTIVERAYDQAKGDIPLPEEAIRGLVKIIGLFLVLGWPITLFIVIGRLNS